LKLKHWRGVWGTAIDAADGFRMVQRTLDLELFNLVIPSGIL
jgi:hypothetical protein